MTLLQVIILGKYNVFQYKHGHNHLLTQMYYKTNVNK